LIGTPAEEARCLTGIGRTAHAQDRTGQAYDYLSEGLALSHAAGQRADVARSLVAIARVAFGQGLRERACRLAGAATAVREQLGLRTFSAPWPFTGTEEEEQQQHALVRWWQQGRSLGLSEAVQEAELLSEEGRQPGSRRRTAPLGDGPARTQKDNTSSDTASSAETTHPRMRLTEREYEIALLVSSGKSNPEIARALFIAPATAARHVANINRKMGFNSRAQIAAWITQHESAS
ncbi:MAG TPA: LuxR C-terminal-related transcriptional regulator, partial [Candidatus Nocardiopsis merdipullorum]|nr:LuxR C-terminal-related transcriptional regulator [Candidatus Nocardiopsis merdipullorum]